MEKVKLVFMIAVVGIVLILFGVGIWAAAYYSLWIKGAPKPGDMPGIVTYFVSAVNGTLAANLGALLGISIAVRGWRKPQNSAEMIQWIAAGWYLLMLLLAIIFWGLAGFIDDPLRIVSILPEMTKNAIGIFIAILGAVLGVQQAVKSSKTMAQGLHGHVRSEPSDV